MKAKPSSDEKKPDVLRRVRLAAWCLAALIALAAWPTWKWVAATYGPYSRQESQCLVCHRERTVEKIYGRQPLVQIDTNEYSDWIDTFVPEHEHVWSVHTGYHRSCWFGSKSIGCGGIPTLSAIYRQRDKLGEVSARRLVGKFHALIETNGQGEYRALDAFTDAVHNDPQSLLDESRQE